MELNVKDLGFSKTIALLKTAVNTMLNQQSPSKIKAASDISTAKPSTIWSEGLQVYSYLMNLSADDFRNIRFHTMLINGWNIFQYWHPYPPFDKAAGIKQAPLNISNLKTT